MPGGGEVRSAEERGMVRFFLLLLVLKSFSLNEHEKLFRTLELFCWGTELSPWKDSFSIMISLNESDFIDFSKGLFFISTRSLARIENTGTFRAHYAGCRQGGVAKLDDFFEICFTDAVASGTTTLYVVLWEYWKRSIAPNREISAWLVGPPGKSHSPGCVGGSTGGSWPNWSRCSRALLPPGRCGKTQARRNAKNAPQWEAGGP